MRTIKKYIDFKNLLILFFVFLLFYYIGLIKIIPIKLLHLNYNDPLIKIILTCFSNTILLIILLLIYKKELIKEFKIFKKNLTANLDIGIKYWLLGLLIMMASNLFLNIIFKAGGAGNEKQVQEMIKNFSWTMIIIAGIIGPIIEEIIFRKCFRNTFKNKYLFIVLSGFIFGLLHVTNYLDNPIQLLYIIPYGSLGTCLAISYEKTNTIFTPISMHIIHNTILIMLSTIAL